MIPDSNSCEAACFTKLVDVIVLSSNYNKVMIFSSKITFCLLKVLKFVGTIEKLTSYQNWM